MATYVIGALTDDATEVSGAVTTTTATTTHDHDATTEWSGLRFLTTGGTGPPQGATITAASILFTIAALSGAEPDVTIFGDKSVSSVTFAAATANGISGRTKTSASVNWSENPISGAGTNTTHPCSSLVTVVQELANQASWTTSSPMTFLIQGGSNLARDLQYRMYEYTGTGGTDPQGTYSPVLTVTWTAVAAGGAPRMLMTGVG